MSGFDDRYWNLAQAAVWIVYRSRKLVDRFQFVDRDAYVALGFYPKMNEFEPVGSENELRTALVKEMLAAWGVPTGSNGRLEQITGLNWSNLTLSPPHAFAGLSTSGRLEPWTDIRVRSADVKRLWRSEFEKSGRTKYDWDLIISLWKEAVASNPDFTQNGLIEEVQYAYRDRFNKEPPGRSSFQRHLKTWA